MESIRKEHIRIATAGFLAGLLMVSGVSCSKSGDTAKSLAGSAQEFSRLLVRSELTDKPSFERKKLALVARGVRDEFSFIDLSKGYDMPPALLAHLPQEVTLVVVADCAGTERIEDFVSAGAPDVKIPAYDRVCQFSIVDRALPAVIYQTTLRMQAEGFWTKQKEVTQDNAPGKVVAEYQQQKIIELLRSLIPEKFWR